MTGGGDILVLNAGSSSIKFAVFDADLKQKLAGSATEIGGAAQLEIDGESTSEHFASHSAALSAILNGLGRKGITIATLRAAAHRVVHGGHNLTKPVRITPEVLTEIANCSPLAPLHNPHNLAAIEALAAIAPDLPQFASFDTSFHATNPKVATRYAIPKLMETRGIRRYGFHGLSYASLVQSLPEISGKKLPSRLLAFHLGNGASLCAIKNGESIATTMGYSPLDGLTMGTRSGGIDANAVLRLVEDYGLDRTKAILNNESGLLGLSGGTSDMRKLMLDHTADSDFAVEHFCYWTIRHAGGLIAAMEGLDAIAFTGGIGENALGVRARILRSLGWLGVALDPDANHRGAARLHADTSKVAIWVGPGTGRTHDRLGCTEPDRGRAMSYPIAKVTATAATISSTLAPRDRSQTGRRKPCRNGPTARAPASSCASLYAMLPASSDGNTSTLALPPPPPFFAAIPGLSAASACNGPAKPVASATARTISTDGPTPDVPVENDNSATSARPSKASPDRAEARAISASPAASGATFSAQSAKITSRPSGKTIRKNDDGSATPSASPIPIDAASITRRVGVATPATIASARPAVTIAAARYIGFSSIRRASASFIGRTDNSASTSTSDGSAKRHDLGNTLTAQPRRRGLDAILCFGQNYPRLAPPRPLERLLHYCHSRTPSPQNQNAAWAAASTPTPLFVLKYPEVAIAAPLVQAPMATGSAPPRPHPKAHQP